MVTWWYIHYPHATQQHITNSWLSAVISCFFMTIHLIIARTSNFNFTEPTGNITSYIHYDRLIFRPKWETDQHHHSKTQSTVVLLALCRSLYSITHASWMQNSTQFAPAIVCVCPSGLFCAFADVKINVCDRFLSGCMVTLQ